MEKIIHIGIDETLHGRLKAAAAMRGQTMRESVIEAIAMFIDKTGLPPWDVKEDNGTEG